MIQDQKKQQARLSILEKLKQKGFTDLGPFPGKSVNPENEEEPDSLDENLTLPMEEEGLEEPGEGSPDLSLDMVLQPKFIGKKKKRPGLG